MSFLGTFLLFFAALFVQAAVTLPQDTVYITTEVSRAGDELVIHVFQLNQGSQGGSIIGTKRVPISTTPTPGITGSLRSSPLRVNSPTVISSAVMGTPSIPIGSVALLMEHGELLVWNLQSGIINAYNSKFMAIASNDNGVLGAFYNNNIVQISQSGLATTIPHFQHWLPSGSFGQIIHLERTDQFEILVLTNGNLLALTDPWSSALAKGKADIALKFQPAIGSSLYDRWGELVFDKFSRIHDAIWAGNKRVWLMMEGKLNRNTEVKIVRLEWDASGKVFLDEAHRGQIQSTAMNLQDLLATKFIDVTSKSEALLHVDQQLRQMGLSTFDYSADQVAPHHLRARGVNLPNAPAQYIVNPPRTGASWDYRKMSQPSPVVASSGTNSLHHEPRTLSEWQAWVEQLRAKYGVKPLPRHATVRQVLGFINQIPALSYFIGERIDATTLRTMGILYRGSGVGLVSQPGAEDQPCYLDAVLKMLADRTCELPLRK